MNRQLDNFGCGVYAVANALNKDSFVTDERLEVSKTGNNLFQLNKWLDDDGIGINISPLYFNIMGGKLPKNISDTTPNNETHWMPGLLDVMFSEGGKFHFIAVNIFKSGIAVVYDSLREEPFESTLEGLNKEYHTVCGLYGFACNKTNNWITMELISKDRTPVDDEQE